MTNRLLIAATCALTLSACAGGSSKPTETSLPVVGAWQGESVTGDTSDSQRVFIVRSDSVTFRNTCLLGDQPVTVEVTSPAILSATHINVLADQRVDRPVKDSICTATLTKGLLAYQIKDGQLILLDKKGLQTSFGQKVVRHDGPGFGARALDFAKGVGESKFVTKLGQSLNETPQ